MTMIRKILANVLVKVAIPLLLGLALFGVFSRAEAWIACGLLVLWRGAGLAGEWRRSRQPLPDWDRIQQDLRSYYSEQAALKSGALDRTETRPTEVNVEQLATSHFDHLRARWVPPRAASALIAEGCGLFGYVLLLPLVVALSRLEFFSFRRSNTTADLAVLVGALLLYAAPHLRQLRKFPMLNPWWWWFCPFVVFLILAVQQISTRHPYLDPFRADHRQLAAEKVLGLTDTILAADHADWVADYAEDLALKGEREQALQLCERALRLRPRLRPALNLLEKLGSPVMEAPLITAPDAPYFAPGESTPKARRIAISKELEKVSACTVVLMPMGEIGDDVLDYVAAVITRELGMPALVYERAMSLPEHTRRRGLLGGPQWNIEALYAPLRRELGDTLPQAPLRFLVLTSADMYAGDANFLFNVSWEWGGMVATAQFDRAGGDRRLLCQRIAKQSLSAVIKSFAIPASTDTRCVTSYPASLGELDAKGNRPMPTTRATLEKRLREINEPWQRYRASQP